MIIGFKPQFVFKILAGTKIHTIREDRNKRWKEGVMMHMATGVRTKNYKCFNKMLCTGCQIVQIKYPVNPCLKYPVVIIDGNVLSDLQLIFFICSDGFDSLQDFVKWFPNDFIGRLIHWTNKRY